ncbi:MAG: hypothetical protein K2Q22_11450 [Cytophagales bacterium]|nr:hypothetical protein [Cytophagales bacterium]
MVIKISKNKSQLEVAEEMKKMEEKSFEKLNDLSKYVGKVNFDKDGLDYQKAIRNEWS